MRQFLVLMFLLLSGQASTAQQFIFGKVVSRSTGNPIAFVKVMSSNENFTYSNILGDFELEVSPETNSLIASKRGYFDENIPIIPQRKNYYKIELSGNRSAASQTGNTNKIDVNLLIAKAIENKVQNDPSQALQSYKYSSYNKLVIDKQRYIADSIQGTRDSSGDSGRSFYSEKVSEVNYLKNTTEREFVTGLKTYGFNEPVYEVLTLNIEPVSIYEDDYPLYGTNFAGPLGKNAFRNYEYSLLDTVEVSGRPGYMIYYTPKRPNVVAGWQGILFLDTVTLGVQRSMSQLSGKIHIEIHKEFTFLENENLWFPSEEKVKIKPGRGGQDITIFGGSISVGTVQRKSSILNWVISTGNIEEDLELTSTTYNYDISPNIFLDISRGDAAITVTDSASLRSEDFWNMHRPQSLDEVDERTEQKVTNAITKNNILRKIEVLHTLLTGYYPVKFWDFDLSNFVKYNNYEGLRLGAGGRTNQNFSQLLRLDGYLVYGIKDEAFKYGVGGGISIDHRSGTWWNFSYNQDLREVAVNEYIRGVNEFSILEPRTANISSYYSYKTLQTSFEHRITPRFETEVSLSRSEISQTKNYAYLNNGEIYTDYTISEAKFGILWRPFSSFLSTPEFHQLYEKNYPVITAQVTQGIAGVFDGDFSFTKFGLKAEYLLNRQDRSITQFTLEGNFGIGDLPLTHAYHAFPNNAVKEKVMQRFAVAGKIAFETMYFDEFFSDKQAAVHIRHQLRPINIIPAVKPELSFISRHVIGDFKNREVHRNVNFNTLQHLYNEAGVELNNIFFGLGLSAAYRYGAYHLPELGDNFSFKFTFELKI